MNRTIELIISLFLVLISVNAFATPIDLTANTSVTASDGSIWNLSNDDPTGTGVYEPFLRVGAKDTEIGLNTDAASHLNVYDDQGGGDGWTHAVKWGDLGIVTVDGMDYYDFTLDINEADSSTARYLALNVFQLYDYNGELGGSATDVGSLGTPVYDLAWSNPTGPSVLMDYSLTNQGSGGDDIEALIPVISGINPDDYLYLYCVFGNYASYADAENEINAISYNGLDWGADASFEEWRVLQSTSTNPVPEPATMLLFGTGLAGLAGTRLKRKKSRSA